MILRNEEKEKCIKYLNELIQHYYSNENMCLFDDAIMKRDAMRKEYSRGGIYIYRGAYCRSLLLELLVTNTNRGKMLKRFTKKKPDYIYYFNSKGNLALVSRLSETNSESFDWISWENENIEFSISKPYFIKSPFTLRICKSYFDDSHRLIKNIMSTSFIDLNERKIERFELFVENYYYESTLKKGTILHVASPYDGEAHSDEHCYEFVYDSEQKVQGCWVNNNQDILVSIPHHLKGLISEIK